MEPLVRQAVATPKSGDVERLAKEMNLGASSHQLVIAPI